MRRQDSLRNKRANIALTTYPFSTDNMIQTTRNQSILLPIIFYSLSPPADGCRVQKSRQWTLTRTTLREEMKEKARFQRKVRTTPIRFIGCFNANDKRLVTVCSSGTHLAAQRKWLKKKLWFKMLFHLSLPDTNNGIISELSHKKRFCWGPCFDTERKSVE